MSDVVVETLSNIRELLQVPPGQDKAPLSMYGQRAELHMDEGLAAAAHARSLVKIPTPDEIAQAEALHDYLVTEKGYDIPIAPLKDEKWLAGHNLGIVHATGSLAVALDRGYQKNMISREPNPTGLLMHVAGDYLVTAAMLGPIPGYSYFRNNPSIYYSAEEVAEVLHSDLARGLGLVTIKRVLQTANLRKFLLPEVIAAVRGLGTADVGAAARAVIADYRNDRTLRPKPSNTSQSGRASITAETRIADSSIPDPIAGTLSSIRESLQIPRGQSKAPVTMLGQYGWQRVDDDLKLAVQARIEMGSPTSDELLGAEKLSRYLVAELGYDMLPVDLKNKEWLTACNPGITCAVGVLAVALDRGYQAGAVERNANLDYRSLIGRIGADYLVAISALESRLRPDAAYLKRRLFVYYDAEEITRILHSDLFDGIEDSAYTIFEMVKRRKYLLPDLVAAVRGADSANVRRLARVVITDATKPIS